MYSERIGISQVTLRHVVFYSATIGVIGTSLGYKFGVSNHIEQLPMVFRAIDSSFLSNDFFTNSTAGFGPRFYYVEFIALLARFWPLVSVFLILLIFSNTAIALISALMARDLFNGSNIVAIFAAGSIISLRTFGLGWRGAIPSTVLIPDALAMPLLLLSIWMGLKNRPIASAVSAGIASLLHPVLGLEIGALMVLTLGVETVHGLRTGRSSSDRNHLPSMLVAVVILIGFSALYFVPYLSSEQIGTEELVRIYANFRHPHHLLPSTLSRGEYLDAIAFIVASGMAWLFWRRSSLAQTKWPVMNRILILTVLVMVLCIGGYLFVEVVPSRLWIIAQTLRLLFVVKWIGLVLVTGTIWRQFSRGQNEGSEPDTWLRHVAMLTPLTLGYTHVLKLLRDRARSKSRVMVMIFATGPTLVATVIIMLIWPPPSRSIILFPIFTLMAVVLIAPFRKRVAFAFVTGLALMWFIALIWNYQFLPTRVAERLERPIITLSNLSNNDLEVDLEVTSFVRSNTPYDAVFLTPPLFGQFRLLAERAIVVDFKAFPFQGLAMLEWRQRLIDSYGSPEFSGFSAVGEMDVNYRMIDDSTLGVLQSKYGVSYAILYRETTTSYPSIFESDIFKVVSVGGGSNQ